MARPSPWVVFQGDHVRSRHRSEACAERARDLLVTRLLRREPHALASLLFTVAYVPTVNEVKS